MRAVFDSNIFVSAFAFSGGRAEAALQMVLDDRVHLVISKFIIHEILDVLARKFKWTSIELTLFAVYLSELGEIVQPPKKIEVFSDEADNRILECALAGQADWLVTGDKKMLEVGEYKNIKIVSLRVFLETV